MKGEIIMKHLLIFLNIYIILNIYINIHDIQLFFYKISRVSIILKFLNNSL